MHGNAVQFNEILATRYLPIFASYLGEHIKDVKVELKDELKAEVPTEYIMDRV